MTGFTCQINRIPERYNQDITSLKVYINKWCHQYITETQEVILKKDATLQVSIKIQPRQILYKSLLERPLSCIEFCIKVPNTIQGKEIVHTSALRRTLYSYLKTTQRNLLKPIQKGTPYFLNVYNKAADLLPIVLVAKIERMIDEGNMSEQDLGLVWEDTDFSFSVDNSQQDLINLVYDEETQEQDLQSKILNIGGLDTQLKKIIRRCVKQSKIPFQIRKQLGMHPLRGIILHGPPGTGKTTIARAIAQIFNQKEPIVIRGPELFDKYVGEAEKKLRETFVDAIEDQKQLGDRSPIHTFVFDEIDSMAGLRAQKESAAGNNSLVSQFLSIIDGIDFLDNIFIIGTTNRLDLVDPAIKRPGRLGMQLYIGIPDSKGRQDIFRIHTDSIQKNGILNKDVNLQQLAEECQGFTGAEIEEVIRITTSYVLDQLAQKNVTKQGLISQTLFLNAIREYKEGLNQVSDQFMQQQRAQITQNLSNELQMEFTNAEIQQMINLKKPSQVISIMVKGPVKKSLPFIYETLTTIQIQHIILLRPINYISWSNQQVMSYLEGQLPFVQNDSTGSNSASTALIIENLEMFLKLEDESEDGFKPRMCQDRLNLLRILLQNQMGSTINVLILTNTVSTCLAKIIKNDFDKLVYLDQDK